MGLERGGVEAVGKQRFDVFDGSCFGQFGEDVTQIGIRLVPVRLGRLNDGIKLGTGASAGLGVSEFPVVSADTKRPEGALGGIVIDVEAPVLAIAH